MPLIVYKNKAGKRVSGVTTVLNTLGYKSGGLYYWNWQRGADGFDYWDKTDANIGTCMHEMIECDIKGTDFDASPYSDDILEKANNAFGGWSEWKQTWEFEPVSIEESLVSEKYQCGGTPDCIPKIRGKLSIFDWKSSKAVYADYKIQVKAYGLLWEENHPDQPITGGYHIVCFNKESLGFDHWYRDAASLDICTEAWERAVWLHQNKKLLEQL